MDSAGNPDSLPGIHSDGVWGEVTERLRQVCVQIYGQDGVRGSGVVWTPDGFIVTNAHLVNGPATVQLHSGRTCLAGLVRRHPSLDLAVLHIPMRGLQRAELRDSQSLRPGELVIALGHPHGVREAVSAGIVHAGALGDWIETDVRLAPGNSGGPLADAAGRVVGVNSLVWNGIGLAVSTAAILRFLRPLTAAQPSFGGVREEAEGAA